FVSVTDSQGVPITGLDASAFQVLEDGKPVSGFTVNPVVNTREPVAIAFAIDLSGSMNDGGKLDFTKQAMKAFIDSMAANDTVAVLTFSDGVNVAQGYTSDKTLLSNVASQLKASGNRAMYDAVTEAAQFQAAVPQRRKVILLMTSGDDNGSKQNVDGAIAAAKNAGTPVFVIGLGSAVNKDALDKLATSTGGQSVYAPTADQLQKQFLYISDELRRDYSFQFTSKLVADDKSHQLTVRATYQGTTTEATGSFDAKKPVLTVGVAGITNATKVSGTQQITVTAKAGTIQQVELLVDGKSEATATTAPYVLSWDTTKETPGIHKVIIRAKDASGAANDTEFAVQVANAAPAGSTVGPAAVVATVPAGPSPTAVPTPTPAVPATNPLYYAIAGAAVLVAILAGILGVVLYRRPKVAAPPPLPAPPPPPREQTVITDRTEPIIFPPPSESTIVAGNATVVGGMPSAPRLPRGKLVVVQNGAKSEVTIQQVETILGREATNPVVIRDPMSSRRHAKIVIENGEFWVEDLKSLNGTRVNGEVITRRKLASNDQIKIGDATVTFTSD
ncbi:MAG TPA: VWA domain-containing protein, partial [Chloroflexota bacterium]|nr:VWA domain-containing protein [Chloroflexota bacterium]